MGERFRAVLSRVGSPPICLALAVFLASRSSNNSRDPFSSVFFFVGHLEGSFGSLGRCSNKLVESPVMWCVAIFRVLDLRFRSCLLVLKLHPLRQVGGFMVGTATS